jgi:hypothetical protein
VFVSNMSENRLNIRHISCVAGKWFRTAAAIRNGIGDGTAAVYLSTRNDDMGTLIRQKPGNGLTDAATGTGDQGDFTGQIKKIGRHEKVLYYCVCLETHTPLGMKWRFNIVSAVSAQHSALSLETLKNSAVSTPSP